MTTKKTKNIANTADVSLLKRLLDADNDENITLYDTDGNPIELEQVAIVTEEGEIYAVLHVIGTPDEEVVVFRVDPNDEESITMVEDETLGNKILKFIMEESAKD